MKLDLTTSTVTIAGRRFPACNVVCPPYEDDTDTDWERSLGGPYGPGILNISGYTLYIPLENGALVSVETEDRKPGVYKVMLHSATCHLSPGNPDPLWVPQFVSIVAGRLVAHVEYKVAPGPFMWEDAEPEWLVEFIDRVSRMPFTNPPGPRARPISLAESTAIDVGR